MSRKLLDKNFCALPWSGFIMESDGSVKNCILARKVIGNIHKNTITEVLNSDENKNIKKEMLQGGYPKSCDGCFYQEQGRKTNFDTISSRLYYAKELGPHVKKNLFDSVENFDLTHVDLRWSNKCNQACVYCGSHNSTKWAKELGIKQSYEKQNIEKVKEYVFSNIKNLKNVYLAGGEPLMMNENKEFLKLLLKENKDVNLRVNTNLSNTKTGVFQLIQQFKNVHWTISVESIEKEYEYIRYGGKWSDFVRNLETISSLKGHRVSFNMLHFILNYMSIFDCIEFLQSLGFHNNSFVVGPLYTPVYLNIKNLDQKSKKEVKRKLEDLIDDKPGFLLQNGLENSLKYLTEPGFYANIKEVKRQIEIMDNRRNIDSKIVFHKLYNEVLN